MPRKTGWIGEDDVHVSSTQTPMVGRRFSMDINEDLLAQVGARALEHAIEKLGQHVAYEHLGDIQRAVDACLMDKAWIQPILEDELRRCTRDFVLSLWSDDEKKAQREWFDVFTNKFKRANESQ